MAVSVYYAIHPICAKYLPTYSPSLTYVFVDVRFYTLNVVNQVIDISIYLWRTNDSYLRQNNGFALLSLPFGLGQQLSFGLKAIS